MQRIIVTVRNNPKPQNLNNPIQKQSPQRIRPIDPEVFKETLKPAEVKFQFEDSWDWQRPAAVRKL